MNKDEERRFRRRVYKDIRDNPDIVLALANIDVDKVVELGDMVIREEDLKKRFEELLRERCEQSKFPMPDENVLSIARWAAAKAYSDMIAIEKNTPKAKAEKAKVEKKTKKEVKEPEKPNAGVSLATMGLIQPMSDADKAQEEAERAAKAEERKKLEAASKLDVGVKMGALVKECDGCDKADTAKNECKILEDPSKAWKHKSGKCPSRGIITKKQGQ